MNSIAQVELFKGLNSTADRPCHIHDLGYDILQNMITIECDIFEHHMDGLGTALLVSSVCRSWRNILLNMPTFWAKLFDLDHPAFLSEEWQEEMMRRSGSALLWIKAIDIKRDSPKCLVNLLHNIVDKHWGRIEKLEVRALYDDHFQDKWTSALCCSAPHLTDFNLDILVFQDLSWEKLPLFANHAPRLRKFSLVPCALMPSVHAVWMRNLIDLSLQDLSLNDVLMVLKHTPLLQFLSLSLFEFPEPNWHIPTEMLISLPCLSSLSLLVHDQSCAVLLSHLVLPPGCSFTFHQLRDSPEEHHFIPALHQIHKLAISFFSVHKPHHVRWSYDIYHTLLLHYYSSYPSTSYFHIALTDIQNSEDIRTLLRTLCVPEMASVTCMQIENTTKLPLEDLAHMMASHSAIEELRTVPTVLEHLTAVAPGSLPPHLWTVALTDLEIKDKRDAEDRARVITDFMRHHRIGSLDLSKCNTDDTIDVVRHFAKHEQVGLYVDFLKYI